MWVTQRSTAMPLGRSRHHQRKTSPDRPPQRQTEGRGDQGGQPRGSVSQKQHDGRREQEGQSRGKQNDGQIGEFSGWNRVGKKGAYTRESELQTQDKRKQATRFEDMGKEIQRIRLQIAVGRVDYIPSGSIQIREPLLVPNSGMIDQRTPVMGKKKKRRSPASRSRYRETRRLRRLKEMEGIAASETEGSEFETDDGGRHRAGRDLSHPPSEGVGHLNWTTTWVLMFTVTGLISWRMKSPVEDESSMAMILHDGTADAKIIHEAKMAKGVRIGAASNGSSHMEIASNGDRRPAIEAPVKKARVSTSRTA